MEKLTSRRRAELRALAHAEKPVQHVGKEGVTSAVVRSLEEAFNKREIVKVRVLESAPLEPKQTANAIAAEMDGVHVVQVIGRVVVLFREAETG